jgi:hypothetical protein
VGVTASAVESGEVPATAVKLPMRFTPDFA